MRTRAIWIGVVLVLGVCGLAVSQALSLERWVDTSRLGVPPALAQETRPPASPVLRSRFTRPVPAGWSAPRLVEEPGHPGQALLTRVGLPSAHAADVALPPVAGLSLVEAAGVGPWPRPIPVAASVMHYRPALGRAVSPEACAAAPGGRQPLGSTIANATPDNEAMPDKCDDKILGKWICGQMYGSSGRWPSGGIQYTFSRTIGEGGHEYVRLRYYFSSWISTIDQTDEWKVDRKWHPAPLQKGKLAAATCDGWNKHGDRILAVYDKNPDGSDREVMEYFVDSKGTMSKSYTWPAWMKEGALWIERYEVWWVGDEMHQKLLDRTHCNREP